jgi:cob(I)alamin adenosyltransferase
MKVYTKTGDTGTTSLFEGLAYRKIILEFYGTVDELNST